MSPNRSCMFPKMRIFARLTMEMLTLTLLRLISVSHAGGWTPWTACPGSLCFQSRFLRCDLDNIQTVGFDCAKLGEAYFESLGSGCTGVCEEWLEGNANSLCIGNCYSSKMKQTYICANESACMKTQMQKCYNYSTCLGRWADVSVSDCSVTCGLGTRVVQHECKINSYASYNCPGSAGTSSSTNTIQNCYNCNDWGDWSKWTECETNCTRSRSRSCAATKNPTPCNVSATMQNQTESCFGGFCTNTQHTTNSLSHDTLMYVSVGAGGAVLLLFVIIILSVTFGRRQKKPTVDDNKKERVHITEITDGFSVAPNGARVRHSFGSHYENLYTNPEDMVQCAKLKKPDASKRHEGMDNGKEEHKHAVVSSVKPIYSMALDVVQPSYETSQPCESAADTDSFEDDVSSNDVDEEESRAEEAVYATIPDRKPTETRPNPDEKYTTVKKKKKKTKKKKHDSSPTVFREEPTPYYESSFSNRGFVIETSQDYSDISHLERSKTIKTPRSLRGDFTPRFMSTRVKKAQRKAGRSVTEIRMVQRDVKRARSVTAPVQPLRSPGSPPSGPQYTDMSGAAGGLQSVQYTDMAGGRKKFASGKSYENVAANFVGYTDMSSRVGETSDPNNVTATAQEIIYDIP